MSRSHVTRVMLAVVGALLTAGTLALAFTGTLGKGKLSMTWAGIEWALPLVAGAAVGVLAWTFLVERAQPRQETPKRIELACPSCGRPILESWRLCPHCGALISEVSPVGDAAAEG